MHFMKQSVAVPCNIFIFMVDHTIEARSTSATYMIKRKLSMLYKFLFILWVLSALCGDISH